MLYGATPAGFVAAGAFSGVVRISRSVRAPHVPFAITIASSLVCVRNAPALT